MTKERRVRLHRIYNIITAVLMIMTGLLLCCGCLYIYYGVGEYTRDVVAHTFDIIGLPVLITALAVFGGLVFELFSPYTKRKPKVKKDYVNLRKKLLSKKDLSKGDREIAYQIKREKSLRTTMAVIRVGVCVLMGSIFLIYALNPDNYHRTDISDSMIGAMLWMVPCLFVSGFCAIFTAVFNERSLKREIELIKKLNDEKGEASEKRFSVDKGINIVLCGCFILAAVILIVFGILGDGFEDVMTKAVNICTECIGLG